MSWIRDDEGVVAVIFAIIAIPFIALAGWGVDYLRLYHVRDALQSAADAAVLHALVENADPEAWRGVMRDSIAMRYGSGGWISGQPVIAGEWINTSDFQVTATAAVPLIFMSLIPGVPPTQDVSVAATARLNATEYDYPPIEIADLDPEAADYNRIWLYCFWPGRSGTDPEQPRRTQMVPIADNAGSTFESVSGDTMLTTEQRQVLEDYTYGLNGREKGIWRIESFNGNRTTSPIHTDTRSGRHYIYRMPVCEHGSYMSYRLENVRFSRNNARYWDSGAVSNTGGDRHTGRYNYYTDTILEEGRPENHTSLAMNHPNRSHVDNGRRVDILETVLCDTLARCVNAPRGQIPTGTNRRPNKETRPCEPGKYMYYGWEDRPPGLTGGRRDWQDYAWTDADYDDIRIIVPCPVPRPVDERSVRLIR